MPSQNPRLFPAPTTPISNPSARKLTACENNSHAQPAQSSANLSATLAGEGGKQIAGGDLRPSHVAGEAARYFTRTYFRRLWAATSAA